MSEIDVDQKLRPDNRISMNAVSDDRMIYGPAADSNDDDFDLGEILGVLVESKWIIVTATLVIFIIGAIYTFTATPIYKADGLLQVEQRDTGLGDINALFEADTSVYAEIEILRSRLILGQVVDNLKLDIIAAPDYFPVFGTALARRAPKDRRKSVMIDTLDVPASLIGQPFTLIAGEGRGYQLFGPDDEPLLTGKVGESANTQVADGHLAIFVSELSATPKDTFWLEKQSRLTAIEQLQASLSIIEKGKHSGILEISLRGRDPENVTRNLNEIANVYVRTHVERKSAEAEQTLAFLDEQLPIIRQDMETAEAALNGYRLEKGSIDLPLETQGILNAIVSIDGQINQLEQEREKVTQGFTPAHPMVIALDKQIERLNSELDELSKNVRELPNTQQEVLRLVRDVAVNTELYTTLLNTAQELRVVKAGTVGNVSVVDFAVPRYWPVSPNKAMILLISLMLGAVVGVTAAFVSKALRAGVDDPDLIEKHINIPVYATIGHSNRQDRIYDKLESKEAGLAILATDTPDDTAIESLRNLRTALHFGTMDVKNNCIMIAGPSPTVGKSFISVNLAAVLTSNNKKVLLIDGDLRRGHLHKYLGLERTNGLSDFISGEISLGDAQHITMIDGLSFIPTGKLPPNPAELLLHERFANCLSSLDSGFDHIIIDSPPILAVTDATIIGQMAGATLMVLKAGEHPIREIEVSVKRLQQANVNLRGVLFNDVKLQSRKYGAGKYNYHYSYQK